MEQNKQQNQVKKQQKELQFITCNLYLAIYANTNSKWITDFNVKPKTIQLIIKEIEDSFVRGWQRYVRYDTKSEIHKKQIDKLYIIKRLC